MKIRVVDGSRKGQKYTRTESLCKVVKEGERGKREGWREWSSTNQECNKKKTKPGGDTVRCWARPSIGRDKKNNKEKEEGEKKDTGLNMPAPKEWQAKKGNVHGGYIP